jgi:hypothetical protein
MVNSKICLANFLAEGVGFEPTSPFREAVFKTAALNHSAIPPCYTSFRSSESFVLCSERRKQFFAILQTTNSELITLIFSFRFDPLRINKAVRLQG